MRPSGAPATPTPAGEALLIRSRKLLTQANNLERNASQISSGWERELRIGFNDIVPQKKILGLVNRFYQKTDLTNIRLSNEVLSGSWDALLSDRADLVIGVPHNIPPANYQTHTFCTLEFVFVVSKTHPLAKQKTPITDEQIQDYRVAVVGDTNRTLSTLSYDVFEHQKQLTLPSHKMKIAAQLSGLCIGSAAKHLISDLLKNGDLIIKDRENTRLVGKHPTYFAYRKDHKGKALEWFVEQLQTISLANDWLT